MFGKPTGTPKVEAMEKEPTMPGLLKKKKPFGGVAKPTAPTNLLKRLTGK